ncbi:hypothetical protein BCR42DRAFT_413210 [Absidia repens]|uniref:OB domain-containing protein n=1 Tax=Absidia repens TaxID=90262 RepID=A0A1X2IKU0_9FUNG|nr:hypothetical protein BCR42DRAFT_413210 [Absidia repens]
MKALMYQSTQEHTLLKDIRPMMRRLDIEVIVLQQESETVVTRDGEHINKYLVADKSGVMVLKAWGPSGAMIKLGDILHISGIEMKFNFGRHVLETSKQGKIQRLGQDTFRFAEGPNFSQPPESSSHEHHTTTISQQSYTNTIAIDQQQQFHQPSSSIRPPPATNYITTSSSHFDNNSTSGPSTTAMNFGPGWTSGLGRDRDGGGGKERQRVATLHVTEQGNQFSQKRHLDKNNNKEYTRIVKRKVEYNELV